MSPISWEYGERHWIFPQTVCWQLKLPPVLFLDCIMGIRSLYVIIIALLIHLLLLCAIPFSVDHASKFMITFPTPTPAPVADEALGRACKCPSPLWVWRVRMLLPMAAVRFLSLSRANWSVQSHVLLLLELMRRLRYLLLLRLIAVVTPLVTGNIFPMLFLCMLVMLCFVLSWLTFQGQGRMGMLNMMLNYCPRLSITLRLLIGPNGVGASLCILQLFPSLMLLSSVSPHLQRILAVHLSLFMLLSYSTWYCIIPSLIVPL